MSDRWTNSRQARGAGAADELDELERRLHAIEEHLRSADDPNLAGPCLAVAESARKCNLPDLQVRALRCAARSALCSNDDRTAEYALLQAADVESADPYLIALASRDLARLRCRNDWRIGIDSLLATANTFHQLGDGRECSVTLLEAGDELGRIGDRSSALEQFEAARAMARDTSDPTLVARADDRLAAASWELGRLDRAEQHLRSALAVWEAATDTNALAWAQFRLGWCIANDVRTQQRGEEALRLLRDARAAAQQSGNLGLVADCDEKAAWVLGEFGDDTQAIELLRSAAAVQDAVANDSSLSVTRVNLGERLLAVGAVAEAEYLWRLVLDEPGAGQHAQVGAATRLAAHLARTSRAQDALDLLESVQDLVDRDDRLEGPKFFLACAAAYDALGHLEATREAAQSALDALEGSRLPSMHAESLEFLARCARSHDNANLSDALMGQALALRVYIGELDDARRLVVEMLRDPPELPERPRQPALTTGLYL